MFSACLSFLSEWKEHFVRYNDTFMRSSRRRRLRHGIRNIRYLMAPLLFSRRPLLTAVKLLQYKMLYDILFPQTKFDEPKLIHRIKFTTSLSHIQLIQKSMMIRFDGNRMKMAKTTFEI